MYILNNGMRGEAYNISDEKSNIKLKDLAKILADYSNREVVFELPDEIERRGYSTATKAIMSSRKINELGWHPHYTIEDGLNTSLNIMKDINSKKTVLKKTKE